MRLRERKKGRGRGRREKDWGRDIGRKRAQRSERESKGVIERAKE